MRMDLEQKAQIFCDEKSTHTQHTCMHTHTHARTHARTHTHTPDLYH